MVNCLNAFIETLSACKTGRVRNHQCLYLTNILLVEIFNVICRNGLEELSPELLPVGVGFTVIVDDSLLVIQCFLIWISQYSVDFGENFEFFGRLLFLIIGHTIWMDLQ